MKRSIAFVSVALAAISPACGSSSPPFPLRGPEPASAAFEAVPDAPPPPRPETIRKRSGEGAVWVDGQWERVDGAWRWAHGGWVFPPRGARFTAYRVRRNAAGDLEFAPARWTDANGKTIDVTIAREEAP